MSNFNEYIKNQGAKQIVDRFFSGVDMFNPHHKVSSLDFKIIDEPDQPGSYYIENELTATHKIKLEYTLDGKPEIYYSTFEIPKEIDGAFIIEGAYRISTNKLSSDFDCSIRMSGTGDYYINFDYNRRYDIKKQILRIKRYDSLLGIKDRAIEIPYGAIDKQIGEKKELLKLDEKQIKKLQVKLDLDYVPEYIDTKLIQKCLAFGDDRLKDLIIDKKIESVATGFMNWMFRSNNGSNYLSVRRNINNYFTKFGRLKDEIGSLSRLAFRYFKGSSEVKSGEANLQVPPGINAMNLDSVGAKITIPETVAYNATMADIIDISDTPINQNTNKQNALTVSTYITDEGVLFDVYNKDFQKITILYLDYLNSKVCASEYVDYKTNTIKPDENGEVEVKYRMKRMKVKADEIDLIDLHPDYRLSSVTRQIPFVNCTDSVRISMGTSIFNSATEYVSVKNLTNCWNNIKIQSAIFNIKYSKTIV